MGNSNAKKSISSASERNLERLFEELAHDKTSISYSDLKRRWAHQLTPQLLATIESHFRMLDRTRVNLENFKNFYLSQCKGNPEARAISIIHLLSLSDSVSRGQLLQFILSALESVLLIQEMKCHGNFSMWYSKLGKKKTDSLQTLGSYFLADLEKNKVTDCSIDDVQNVMSRFNMFWVMILSSLYETEENEFFCHLLPACKQVSSDIARRYLDFTVLDIPRIIFINLELPIDYQSEWRLLFTSSVDGESFSSLIGKVVQKGPTVFFIQDKAGYIFGGFAPASWTLGPTFKGDSRSFLFTLSPKMKIFPSTGHNSNFQYMNVGQQTLPNGLGMGGRLEYFGLWLSANYGIGRCNETCSTYRNFSLMSAAKDFHVTHLEVWGVGPPPPTPAELGERSVLDGNAEARAILELAGKTTVSDGFREKHD